MYSSIDYKFERAAQRIEAKYDAATVVEQVFTTDESRTSFINGLCKLSALASSVQVGGSRLRELTGCARTDFSEDIISDAYDIDSFEVHASLRLGPLLGILKRYPAERMSKPDLDFFVWDSTPEDILTIFEERGFKVSKHVATGGVWVINVNGINGQATFVDGKMSWQTGDTWPRFGFFAKLKNDGNPYFDLNIGAGRLFLYPLEIPDMNKFDPLDPKRFAAIARAMLWGVTAVNPDGAKLDEPSRDNQAYYYETVRNFPALLEIIKANPSEEVKYRSGIRDMALALRLIVLNDWHEMASENIETEERAYFFGQLKMIWQTSLWGGGMIFQQGR